MTEYAPIHGILSMHAEDAALLWLSRRSAVQAPHYGLTDLDKVDGRLDAHVDGLRVAGEAGWAMCASQLDTQEVGEVFAAGVLAAESGDRARWDQVLAVVEVQPDTLDGAVSALGWQIFSQGSGDIAWLRESDHPVRRRIGLAANGIHRVSPGAALAKALRDDDFGIRARALKAVGEFGERGLQREVLEGLRESDPEVRSASAWSGGILGIPSACLVLREIGGSSSARAREAADLAARRMDPMSIGSWHKQLAGDPKRGRAAIVVAGASGDPLRVPWLISLMGTLPLARLAGEAFTMITGADLAYIDLERKPPEDFNAGPTEDPKDENVEMDPDDNLPWPEPSLVEKWWGQNRGRFESGQRYILGKPMTEDWLKVVLRDGRQRQRAAAAIELVLRSPGTPLFNVKAPGFRQIAALGKPGPVIR